MLDRPDLAFVRGLLVQLAIDGRLETDAAGLPEAEGQAASTAGTAIGDWPTERLGDLVQLFTGPFGTSLRKSDYVASGTPVVNPQNIRGGRIVKTDNTLVGEDTLRRLASFRLRTGDVVLARRGEMGRCAVVSDEQDGWLCGTGSLVLRPRPRLLPEFLAWFIRSPRTVLKLNRESVGATMRNLNQRILLQLVVPVAPLDHQLAVIGRLGEAVALANDLAAQLTNRQESHAELAAGLARELTV
jgi:type I restriction enzyme S subunit